MKKVFSFIIIFTLLLSLGISAFAVSRNFTVGEDVNSVGLYTVSAGEIITSVSHSGTVPDGLYLQVDDLRQSVSMIGSPISAGNYSFTLNISVSTTDGQSYTRMVDVSGTISNNSVIVTPDSIISPYTTVTPTATASTFTVTKQPGAENRTAGGYAIFIAKASGASDATWTLVAPDGGQYSVDTFKTKFPGITVTVKNEITDGVLTSTITFTDVSTDISGYSAFANFTNSTGTIIKTNSASMTITKASPTPTATATPTATTKPTATVAPTNTPVATPTSPLATNDPASIDGTSTSPVPTESPQDASHADASSEVINHRGSNIGIIIVTVFVGLLTIAIAIILILYVQGKLDLSWLENKLENRHHHNHDDN